MKRWLIASGLCVVSIIWLVWAFPRLHPAADLRLQLDPDAYLASARKFLSSQGMDAAGWKGYLRVDIGKKDQRFRAAFPNDPVAHLLPGDRIQTAFIPPDSRPAAKVTLRPDGRPLTWDFPAPKQPVPADARAVASAAFRLIEGADAAQFQSISQGDSTFSWERTGTSGVKVRIDVTVKKGKAVRTQTETTYPDKFSQHYDGFPVVGFSVGLAWFVVLFAMAWISILREGAGNAARAMRDWPVVRISAVVAVLVMVYTGLQWDDAVVVAPNETRGVTEITGIVVGGLFVGLMAYLVLSLAVLNVRLHPARLRGLRLLPTRWGFSRLVGTEVLGGWLMAPVLVAIPLLCGFLLQLHVFGSFDEDLILVRWPTLNALSAMASQDSVAVLSLLGIMIPTALRMRRVWMRRVLLWIFALITCAMLSNVFPQQPVASLLPAALLGASVVWVYTQFGVLGAVAAFALAQPMTAAAVFFVQPASAYHRSGLALLAVVGALGVLSLIMARSAPEAEIVLAGESGTRHLARTRREELLTEFNVARSAQQQMLPSRPPVLPGYTLAASCEPAREVGGDLYDFLSLDDGSWGIGVADVSGKGVPAALYMTLTKGLLCAASQDSGDPREILKSVNVHLREVARRKVFVTMALGVLDPEARTMKYARAGHNPVVWRRAAQGETRLLSSPGIGLGLSSASLFARTLAMETVALEPGDALVFYSDGLTEAMDKSLEQFGEERLMAAVESADGTNAEATRDSILEAVRTFLAGIHPQDDLTIAVLRVNNDLDNGR